MAKVIRLTARLRAECLRQQQLQAARQCAIDELVLAHEYLVLQIAQRIHHRYTRSGQNGYSCLILLEDMVACGNIGLVEAAQRYRAEMGAFPQFAYRRIRGSIIDAHRRAAYREMQHESIEAANDSLRGEDGGKHETGKGHALSILEAMRDTAPLPDAQLAQREVECLAVRAIRNLPDDERLVIIDALRGASLEETAASRGRSVAWARQKLASGREKVATMVLRDQRAA